MGSVTNGDVFEVGKVHVAWQAWGFVACRLVVQISSTFALVVVSIGFVTKGAIFQVVTLHFTWHAWDFVARRRVVKISSRRCVSSI